MREPGQERRRAGVAVALHAVAVAAHLWLASRVFPVSDAARYHAVASAVARDAAAWDHGLGGGLSTDVMVAVSALLHGVVDDWAGVTVLVVAGSLGARWMLYRALEQHDPDGRASFVAVLALPSLVFWSSALLKESVAGGAMALLLVGALRRDGLGVAVAAVGLVGLGLLRPWLLGCLGVAGLAVLGRTLVQRWGAVAGGAVVAVALVEWGLPLVRQAPLSARLAWQQAAALEDSARSHAPVVDAVPDGLAGQLRHLPQALWTGALRPLPWDAHSLLAAVASVENLALMGLCAVAFSRSGRALLARPGVTLALAFALLASIGIGLTTSNLGTLSRYRALVAPFLWWVVLLGAVGGPPRDPERR